MSAPPAPWRQHTPNALTIARVVLAIIFFAVLTPWSYPRSHLADGRSPDPVLLIAAGIFILAALTDALDGHLARKWRVVSVFGRIMDPFADKLLVIGAFLFLAGPGFVGPDPGALFLPSTSVVRSVPVSGVYPWMVALILGRELLVTSIRGELEGRGIAFAASVSGKLKMILQSVCVPAVLLLLNVPGGKGRLPAEWADVAIRALVWSTVIVTAWSGVPYVVRALKAVGASRPVENVR